MARSPSYGRGCGTADSLWTRAWRCSTGPIRAAIRSLRAASKGGTAARRTGDGTPLAQRPGARKWAERSLATTARFSLLALNPTK
jgi:hypothetical protein